MMEFWFFLALSAIQIIASKVPPGPKGATLKDVDIPKAEDGVELAFVWGRCRIKDFNVTWHGDLSSQRNKVRQGFKKRVVSWDYWLKWQLAICHGPVNKIGNFTYNEYKLKETGSGDNEVIDIPDGGLVRYMGKDVQLVDKILQGTFTFRGRIRANKGHATQAILPQWKSIVDNNAYRGVVTADFYQDTGGIGRGAYIGQQPRVLLMTCDVERTTAGWRNDAVWYPEKLEIERPAANGYEAYKEVNGAHLLYDVLTNPKCGINVDPVLIDDTNWRAMADICYTEKLGLSLEWAKQQSIGEFVDKICDHIKGGVRFNESLGKFQLVLFRANYDVGTIPLFTPNNSRLISYAPSGNAERVNEVHLKYTSVANKFQLATIPAHDIGAQMTQGAQIPATVVREGITDPDTARMVLAWECHQQVTPLSKITIETDRRGRNLGYAGVFLYQEPRHHSVPRVYRAIEVKSSELDDNKCIVVAVADIFAQQSAGWNIGTPQVPEPPDNIAPDPDTGDDSGVGVIDTELTTPPVTPAPGDTYVPAPGATGDWTDLEGHEVTWTVNPDGTGSWVAEPIEDHTLIVNQNTGEWYEYVGGVQLPPPWIPDILTTKGDLVTFNGADYVRVPVGVNGRALVADSTEPVTGLRWKALQATSVTMRGATWVRNGAAIDVPTNVVYVHCPTAGEIVKVVIATGPTGSSGNCVVDIWKSALFRPVAGDSITAAAKPSISGGVSYQDTVLMGWNKTVNAGDWLAFNLDSSTSFRFITVQLFIAQTLAVS